MRGLQPFAGSPQRKRHPFKSLASTLAPMQADVRETEFGCSLELSPMQAFDALAALLPEGDESSSSQFIVLLEQSAWREDDRELNAGEIASRLAIPQIIQPKAGLVVMDETGLRQLVSLCQPSRLVVVMVRGEVDERDVAAVNRAIQDGRSPLLVEVRAEYAIEVLGDRSIVLHARARATTLALIAENFRHYLAAVCNSPAAVFGVPEQWQLERLLDESGALTIRPIETQRFSTSIDVGINTTRERFSKPADRSLIYDLPSHTWHDEP
jgi:hypothetical protein